MQNTAQNQLLKHQRILILLVVHDDTVDRTTDGWGKVRDKTLAKLKKLNTGKAQRIPTLDEVLDLIDGRVAVNIELKGERTALRVARRISQCLESGWNQNQFLVSSFNYTELLRFKLLRPDIRLGLNFGRFRSNFFELAELFECYSIHPPLQRVTYELVECAHNKDLKVFAYTANRKSEKT